MDSFGCITEISFTIKSNLDPFAGKVICLPVPYYKSLYAQKWVLPKWKIYKLATKDLISKF